LVTPFSPDATVMTGSHNFSESASTNPSGGIEKHPAVVNF
jgi:hypothetical protein